MPFEEFKDSPHSNHLGYRNETILAILNLYVTPMPPIKFRLNLTYSLGGDVVLRISRWPPWISKGTILAVLNLYLTVMPPINSVCSVRLAVWEVMLFEEFQNGCHGGHLGYQNGTILAILNLHVATMPPTK